MRSFTRILLTLMLSLSVAATCAAQKNRRAKHPKQKSPTRAREVTVITNGSPIFPESKRMVGSASVLYYKESNDTVVHADLGEVYRSEQVLVNMTCSFDSKGEKVSRPDKVQWLLYSKWNVFKEGDRMLVEADGKQFHLTLEPLGVATDSQINVFPDFGSFEQIAGAQSVKVRVGQVAFTLNDNQREALRDMLRAIETPPK
jgi:hypothetical protein